MPYLLDEIHSVTEYSRQKQGNVHISDHWRIVVHNNSGSYLVHNTPNSGTVATPTSNMSKEWIPYQQLTDKPNKTIHGMLQATGPGAYLEPQL